MIFTAREGFPGRPPHDPAGNLKLRRLPLGHDGIANRCVWRRLRWLRCPESFNLLTLDLFLRRAIAQADLMLLRLKPQNLEIVLAPYYEHGSDARAARRLFLVAIAFRFAFFDL